MFYRICALLFFFVLGFMAGNVTGYDVALNTMGYIAERALLACVKQLGGTINGPGMKGTNVSH